MKTLFKMVSTAIQTQSKRGVKELLADLKGLPTSDQILLGNGSDEVLDLTFQSLL